MTACCQITCTIPWLSCEQLPYPPEHPRISRMRQRDKSDLPLPLLSYNYLLLWYSSTILSSYSLKSTFLAAALPENSKNSSKDLLHQSSEPSIPSSPREEMAINFIVPEVTLQSFFYILLYSCSSANLVTEYFFFLLCSFILYFFRSWPIKSLFLSINLTSSALCNTPVLWLHQACAWHEHHHFFSKHPWSSSILRHVILCKDVV